MSNDTAPKQLKPRAGMTDAEAEAFLAARVEEGKRIDPQICVGMRRYVESVDPYGIFEDPGEFTCINRELFVRNPPDGDWVWWHDLPDHIRKACEERTEREERAERA